MVCHFLSRERVSEAPFGCKEAFQTDSCLNGSRLRSLKELRRDCVGNYKGGNGDRCYDVHGHTRQADVNCRSQRASSRTTAFVLLSTSFCLLCRDLQAAATSDRANAGLFLSLAARCPGKPALHLTLEQGLPVLYASRDEDDATPAASLVQLAFQAMASAWPMICRQRGAGIELSLRAAAEQFEQILGKCEALSKHARSIERSASSLLREAKAIEAARRHGQGH